MKIEESIQALDFEVPTITCDACEREAQWRLVWHDCNIELACSVCYAHEWQVLATSFGGQWICTKCKRFFPRPEEFLRAEAL